MKYPVPEIVEKYLESLLDDKKSRNTVNGYNYDLYLFFEFIKRYKSIQVINDKDVFSIKKEDIEAFKSEQRDNKSASLSRRLSAIKMLYEYLAENGLVEVNPAQYVKKPKKEKRLPKVLNLTQAEKLLDVVKGNNYERDYAIITLFLNCGLRLGELTNIKLGDLEHQKLNVIGKGNKERTIYLNDSCVEALKKYLVVRPQSDSEFLFLNRFHNGFDEGGIAEIVKKWLLEARLEGYSTYKLRHTAATLMYKYGNVDIVKLQAILGHENIGTTEIYTHVDNEQLKEAVNSNPLNNRNKSKICK